MATALVTGASSGIGRAFAQALARRGDALVLVARDTARLEQLASELDSAHGTAVEILSADLLDDAGVERVATRLRDDSRPIDLLVNNAGFGAYGKFVEIPIDRQVDEVRLNVVALLRLCHATLPAMVDRGRGGIINVSSVAGYQPSPLNATYAATKAYVNSFSHALHEESRGSGVRVMVLCPGFTRTDFQARGGYGTGGVPGFLWQSAEEVVDAALRDYDRGRAVCVPGTLNQIGAAITSALPAGVTRRLAGAVVRRTED